MTVYLSKCSCPQYGICDYCRKVAARLNLKWTAPDRKGIRHRLAALKLRS